MKKTVLLVLAVVLLLSLTAVSQAQESPVITVYKDKTTKIIMAVQYTEYKDNSGDVQLIIAHDDDRDLYFDGVRAGDSFTYSINVEETGKYELRISFGWLDSTGKYTIVVDGEEVGILENTIADDENDIERLSDNIALSQSISKMQPLWRRIVLLRYYRNLTQQQTADCLGLSQVKVSREEKKILDFLRSQMIN